MRATRWTRTAIALGTLMLGCAEEETNPLVHPCVGLGSPGDERVIAVATNAPGEVVVLMSFDEPLELGGTTLVPAPCEPLPPGTDVLVKLDSEGRHVWNRTLDCTWPLAGARLHLRDEGDLVLAANAREPVDFGGGPLGPPQGGAIAARFGSTGEHMWSRSYADSGLALHRLHAPDANALTLVGARPMGIHGSPILVDIDLVDGAPVRQLEVEMPPPLSAHTWAHVDVDGSGRIAVLSGSSSCYSPCPECLCCPYVCDGETSASRFDSSGALVWTQPLEPGEYGPMEVDDAGNLLVAVRAGDQHLSS